MKRLEDIDAVRGISIIFIVLGHVFGMSGIGPGMNPFWQWFNVFQVGIFFAVSGYLMSVKHASGQHETFGAFVRKKLRGLLWPYLTFSLIALLFRAVYLKTNGLPVWEALTPNVIETVSGSGVGALWFLPTLFFAGILAYPAVKNKIASAIVFAIAVAVSYCGNLLNEALYSVCGGAPDAWEICIYMVLIRSLISSGMIILGYYLRSVSEKLFSLPKSKRATVLIICFILSIAAVPLCGLDYRVANFNGQPILMFVSVAAMFLVFQSLFRRMGSVCSVGGKVYQALQFLGKNSLIILATHLEWFLVEIVMSGMNAVFAPLTKVNVHYYVRCLIVLAGVICLETGIIFIINHMMPWLVRFRLGKQRN